MRRRKEEARIRDGSWSARKYHKSPTSKHTIYASTSPRLFIPQPTSCLPSPPPSTAHPSPHSPPPVSPSTQSRKLQVIRISQVLYHPPLPISFPVPFPPYHSLPTHPQPPPSTSHPIKTPIPKRERERGRQHTQRRTRRNRSHGPLAISQLRRDRQLPLVADAHIKEALVPSVSASAPWHLPSSPSHPLPSPLTLSLPLPFSSLLSTLSSLPTPHSSPLPLSSSPPPPSSSHPPLLQPLHPSHAKEWTNKPLNNHPLPNLKPQRLSPVVTSIELAPVAGQGAAVVDLYGITALGLARAGVC